MSQIYFILEQHSTFRTVSPSIIRSLRPYTWHQVCHTGSKTVHTASGICHTGSVAACQQAAREPVGHIPDAVWTVLDSWWWTERMSETCTVLFRNKINLRYCASGWFYYRNILRCTVLQMSKTLLLRLDRVFYRYSSLARTFRNPAFWHHNRRRHDQVRCTTGCAH